MGIVDDLQGSSPASTPRFRSKGVLSPVSAGLTVTDETCTSGVVNYPNYAPTAGSNGVFVQTWDTVTPNFSRRSRAGELITNPFRTLKETQTCIGQYAKCVGIGNSCNSPVKHSVYDITGPQAWGRLRDVLGKEPNWNTPAMPRQLLISAADVAAAISVASTKTWEKSNEHSAGILVDVAEFTKTIRMLRDPIQTSSTLIRKIKAGQRGVKSLKGSDLSSYASSLWLQYRFGIRPLVSSVQGVVQALDKIHARKRQTHRGSYPDITSNSTVNVALTTGSVANFVAVFHHTDKLSVRAGLVIEEDLSLSQALGVDASGMLAVPWELVPFSFVADWFANVNDYFSSLVPYLTKSPLSSWTTVKRVSSTTFSVTSSSPAAGFTMQRAIQESRSCIFEEKVRTPGLAGPSIAYKPQAISRVSNDLRVIDAFTLLHQQFLQVFKP